MKKTEQERIDGMADIERKILNLKGTALYNYRIENNYLPVVGEGSLFAEIMFVGEAPGRNEAKTGKPFCGSAGRILEELLQSEGLKREEVYITSIVKDRPPKNRNPLPDEIRLYAPFLDKQIEIIEPKVVVALGKYALEYLLKKFGLENEILPIGQMHGKLFNISDKKICLVALYHPAAAIYNQKLKNVLKEDFQILKKFI